MKTNTWLYNVLICTVHVSVCRRFGLSTFWSDDSLVCRRFGVSTFRFVDVLVVDVSVRRRFDQLPTNGSTLNIKAWSQIWPSFCRRHIQKDFFNGIFYNLALHEFYFLNMINILLYIDLILSIFCPTFKYFNPSFSPLMPRIKYRTFIQLIPNGLHVLI